MELHGASVLVAGASGGLGAPICRLLADEGASLTLMARDEARLRDVGVEGRIVAGDITATADCERAVADAVDHGGGLDAVVCAAGAVAFGPLLELEDDVLDALLAVNLVGPLRLTRAALAEIGEGGVVVNISAVVAENPVANMAAYSASKAALTSLDTSLARELRRRKITVLDARPPHTETGLADRPIAGEAPRLPEGLAPDSVAATIVAAMAAGTRDLPSDAFG